MAGKKEVYLRGPKLLAGAQREALFALAEDLKGGDITTKLVLERSVFVEGEIVCEGRGILAGVPEAKTLLCRIAVFRRKEGALISKGETVARINGPVGFVFGRIRTVLDILAYMSGIASETAGARGSSFFTAGTRKTHPGSRFMEKRALEIGGGLAYRTGLGDGLLIKTDHLTALACEMGKWMTDDAVIAEAIRRARVSPKPIVIEVNTVGEGEAAARAGVDVVMLDNFPKKDLARAIRIIKKTNPKTLVEVSGGVSPGGFVWLKNAGADVASTSHFYSARPLGFRFVIKKMKIKNGKKKKDKK